MAAQLKLVKTSDGSSDIDTVNLLSGGFSLVADGYAPAVAPIGARSVHESITLTLKGTSVDDLAFMVQDIDRKVKEVQWWIEGGPAELYQVWLRVQMDGETNARQAQLLNIEPPTKVNEYTRQETGDYTIIEYTIGIERTPFWEQPELVAAAADLTNIDGLGAAMKQLTQVIYGDVPARLLSLTVHPDSGGSLVTKVWLGFKTSRYGNPANFVPYWPFASYYAKAADVTVVDNGYGLNMIQCDFSSSAALSMRIRFSIAQTAPSNPLDQRGSYTVLMRAKVDAGTVVRARLLYALGLATLGNSPVYRSRALISSSSYDVYEMGTVIIPPLQTLTSEDLTNFYMELDAERVSGSGKLYAYGFVLVPNEAMIKLTASGTDMANPVTIYQKADGTITAVDRVTSLISNTFLTQDTNWSLPAQAEKPYVLIMSNKANDTSSYGLTFHMSYDYMTRWRTLRGAGTFGT